MLTVLANMDTELLKKKQDIININVINGGPTNKLGDFRNITNTSGMSNNTNNRYSNVDAMANRHMNSHD